MTDDNLYQKTKSSLSQAPGALRPLPAHIYSAMQYVISEDGTLAADSLESMVQGMKQYMSYPDSSERQSEARAHKSWAEIWNCGQSRLTYKPGKDQPQNKLPILLIPSLINRAYIFDLPDRSLVRYLNEKGFDIYLLDWGTPVLGSQTGNVEGVIAVIRQAIAASADHCGDLVNALGYCMGGTLLRLALESSGELPVRRAVFMASPWDFAGGDGRLRSLVSLGSPAALQIIEKKGCLPVDWIQSVFALATAQKTVEKFKWFAALDKTSEKARLFVTVEDWLNDGVDLPADLARSCIIDWYRDNSLVDGKYRLKLFGHDISGNPSGYFSSIPALIIASRRDRLVPCESSLALQKDFDKPDILMPETGHIGMITSSRRIEEVWDPLAAWVSRT